MKKLARKWGARKWAEIKPFDLIQVMLAEGGKSLLF